MSCGFLCQTSAYRLVAQPVKISTVPEGHYKRTHISWY